MSTPKPAKPAKKATTDGKEVPKKGKAEAQKTEAPKAKGDKTVSETAADAKTTKDMDAKDDATMKDTSTLDNQPQKTENSDKLEDLDSKEKEKPCVEKKKRDILKLLEDCKVGEDFAKKKKTEESCCTWHKYVFYALPLAAYLPWLFKMRKCPPKCCPPKYCCPCNCEPFCPPTELACAPKRTGCQRQCPPEPDPCPNNQPKCKESDKYSI